mmetsp:Transcript_21692/g.38117  ORF Transcript_21692/g.38117 Transcript_21692/m.38117 type:complete len:237 (-) Transcript_21692:432-1142(-)
MLCADKGVALLADGFAGGRCRSLAIFLLSSPLAIAHCHPRNPPHLHCQHPRCRALHGQPPPVQPTCLATPGFSCQSIACWRQPQSPSLLPSWPVLPGKIPEPLASGELCVKFSPCQDVPARNRAYPQAQHQSRQGHRHIGREPDCPGHLREACGAAATSRQSRAVKAVKVLPHQVDVPNRWPRKAAALPPSGPQQSRCPCVASRRSAGARGAARPSEPGSLHHARHCAPHRGICQS